jgi:rubredoxin
MNDEILKKLESKIGRRGFLRGSGLAAAMVVGVAAASPLIGYAQEQDPSQDDKKKAGDKKTDDKKTDDKKTDDAKSDDKQKSADTADSGTETKLDADGNEYRECPQCGGNMYRQGRTWTCENCGYSYVE